VFALSVVGCFLRRDQDEEEPEDVIASVVSVNPASGSTISPDATITVTFDNPPNTVIASSGTVSVAGKIATITGPFTPGSLVLTLTWGDGSYTVNYTVSAPEPDEPDTEPDPESEPEPDVDTEPPKIIDSTVSDGDTDVDPDPINNVGGIEFLFSEEVTGTITLQTENGDDVGWLGGIKGDKGTLQLVKGRELNYETAYVIAGKIQTQPETKPTLTSYLRPHLSLTLSLPKSTMSPFPVLTLKRLTGAVELGHISVKR
jgi:hypothetical protein